jgi:hypothetical protein
MMTNSHAAAAVPEEQQPAAVAARGGARSNGRNLIAGVSACRKHNIPVTQQAMAANRLQWCSCWNKRQHQRKAQRIIRKQNRRQKSEGEKAENEWQTRSGRACAGRRRAACVRR